MDVRAAEHGHQAPVEPVRFGAAAEALAVLAEQHKLLVANADAGLLLTDGEGRVLSANPSAERLLGLTLAQMRGRGTADARWATVDAQGNPLRPEDLPANRALRTGLAVRGVILGFYRATADGEGAHRWLEVACEPLHRQDEERPYALVCSLKDVTDRLKAELELRESEARYRLLADNISDVIARTSRRGSTSWVSPSVRRLLGYSPQHLVGAPVASLVHPEDLASAVTAYHSLFEAAEDRDVTISIRLRRRGGAYVHVEVVMRAVRAPDGTVAEVQSSARDITARMEAEAARRSAEDVFRLALDHAPMGMAVIGLDNAWITVNSALPRITGHSQEAFESLSLPVVLHADDRSTVLANMAQMVQGTTESFECAARLLTAVGGYVWTELSTTLVRDSAGAPSYLVLQVVDISDRMLAEEELTMRAVTDPLTGLPNRRVLHERLDHALTQSRRNSSLVGLVFIDLDHFKSINDAFGHDAGDEVLRQLGGRLSTSVREVDTAVRLGGDEFVVLCENCSELSELERLADRLMVELNKPYELSWGQVSISCSFGITVGNGPDGMTMLHQADAAMYRSKQQGRSRINVFDGLAKDGGADHLSLEKQLARALEKGEFCLHYQPIRRLVDGSVYAREAHLRWQHPTRGLLKAATFVKALEASPLLGRLGQWMLEQACCDARQWPDDAVVCVNVSPRQLALVEFPGSVADALSSSGLEPRQLQIEITESSILQASLSTLALTAGLTDLGVTLALDGFGTGYSSITALHRLPITTLKIDRTFVHQLPHEPDAVALVTGLLRMGTGLGLHVVAEGVQNEEQAQWLREQHCPLVQGYHFGPPEAYSGVQARSTSRSETG